MFCCQQKGISSHADCDISTDRADPDEKELARVDKEQRRRGDKERDKDRDDKDIDQDIKCSPQKRKNAHRVDDIVTDPYNKGEDVEPLDCLQGSLLLDSTWIYLSQAV